MNVMQIRAPECSDGSEGVLALIASGPVAPGLHFFTRPDCPIQAAAMRHPKGHVLKAHKHPSHPRVVQSTPEVLVVREGSVALTIYTSRGDAVATVTCVKGDIAVLLSGGHRLEMLEDCEIVEARQGPYLGAKDKELF